MRELERDQAATTPPAIVRISLVGQGRLGTALAPALRDAGYEVSGPHGRGTPPPADLVLLTVPDGAIPEAAAAAAGVAPFIGHTSGATPLSALAGATGSEALALHPLQTFTAAGGSFEGCGCATGGETPRALAAAMDIARKLGMNPFELKDEDRPAYHAAASIASNFLVTIEGAAEQVAASAGLPPERARELLAPLVRTAVENWVAHGAERALTGPVARGDDATVERQRAAVAEIDPDLAELFDALVAATRRLAAGVPA
jgi:predicted short-subunit dehydrogenase-like oxidoreductase (DUF2520 family)